MILRSLLLSLALALPGAVPAAAASLLGTWNCQAAERGNGVGRRVTYTADGRMEGRLAFQIKMRYRGTTGAAKLSFSIEGRWNARGNVLAERIDRTHSPAVTVTENGRATRLRPGEAESARRRIEQPNTLRYIIRSLGEQRMVMEYQSPRGDDTNVRITCRRLSR